MSAHLSVEQLSLLVQGQGDLSRWEPHVDGCARCAEAVQREARLELAVRKLFREQRCGTSALPVFRVLPEAAPAPSSPAWRVLAGSAVLSLMLAWLPAITPEPAAGTDVPCAGVVADGGAPLMMAAVGAVETPSAHGTP